MNELTRLEVLRQESKKRLQAWIDSCTEGNTVARNTVAVGIVVLDHMRRSVPLTRESVMSRRGTEIRNARSGLGRVLESYGIPRSYLKEVTTRQGHQDGQRLFEAFQWGDWFTGLPKTERDTLLVELIEVLLAEARRWLQRQNLKLTIDRRHTPQAWIHLILENARGRSAGIVEQHLVGAKLERRFSDAEIQNFPAHAGDLQTERPGDFNIAGLVYHVTANPGLAVIEKCMDNIRAGQHPILIVPREQHERARILAEERGIGEELMVLAIEDFISLNIMELSIAEGKSLFRVLQEVVDIYNRRIGEVETDLSLRIEIR